MVKKVRATIMLPDETVKKLRDIQAKRIKETQKNVSFSSIINEVIRKSLK